MNNAVEKQIALASRDAGKVYAFDETHDARLPADLWFQASEEGEILFVVLYGQACRWSRCLGCNLPSKMSCTHIGYRELMMQIDAVFADPRVVARRESIRKVILSNNGSVLDEKTFSSTALVYFLAKLNLNFPSLNVLTLETRPEYVDVPELCFISRTLAEGDTPTTLELAVGFEAYDEHIRNDVFRKGLSFETFEKLVAQLARFRFSLKCYFMQKPVPDMTDAEGVEDIHRGIDYLADLSHRHGVRINMHLNPTYVARGTPLETAFREGRYQPPYLADVAAAVLHGRGRPISIFVGLSDEGLAVDGGSFLRPADAPLIAALDRFNRTQDYDALDANVSVT